MRRSVLFFLLLIAFSINLKSQVATTYTFTQLNVTYTEITGGTVLGDAATDEQYFVDPAVPLGGVTTTGVGLPIGFNFIYNGSVFDVFAVQANGWISFGQTSQSPCVNMNTSSTSNAISATSTAPAVLQNRVCPLGRTLISQAGGSISYGIEGTTPNRVLVVQWKNYHRSGTSGESYNFQIRLYETTNVVEFAYGPFTVNFAGPTQPQVGLRGTANTDFFNRTTTADWSATTAGAMNNATCTLSTTVYPASGQVFRYTPPLVLPVDAGIIAINSPTTPVPLGNNNVQVTVKNFGTNDLTSASIEWSVNGTAQTSYAYTNPGLVQNATDGPITIGSYNFATTGSYVIKAWTSNPNGVIDGNFANDTTTKIVYVQGFTAIPYFQSFDATWINKLNTRDVPDLFWNNNPATGNNSWRREDDGTSAGWTAGGTYPATSANGSLHSARFHTNGTLNGTIGTLDLYLDFTTVGSKILKFWQVNTGGTDSLLVSMSVDGGSTFSVLQKINTNAAWLQYIIPLGASVSPTVILQFVGKSNAGGSDIGLDEVEVSILPANDAGVVSIDAPISPTNLGNQSVQVTVKNFGTSDLTSASIQWSVDAVAQTPYAYTNPGLVTGATDGPVTIGSYNFTTTGFHTIKTWTDNPNGLTDGDHINDTTTKVVFIQGYAAIPYFQNYDATWINKYANHDVPDEFWVNTPSTGNNSWRRNDEGATAAWVQPNNGVYAPTGANSTANSARFHTYSAPLDSLGRFDLYLDFTPVGTKEAKFWYINTGTDTDYVAVLLSTDGGLTFGTVIDTFKNNTAWEYKTVVLGNSTSSTVVLRFRTRSDYGATDIGIDEVLVRVQPANDLAMNRWISPVSGCGLSSTTPVTVNVKNLGTAAQSNIPVYYSMNGGATMIGPETIAGPLIAGDSIDYTFTATANFSSPGTYNCLAVVALGTDTYHLNDTIFRNIFSLGTISGNPFSDDLETGNIYLNLIPDTLSGITYANNIGKLGSHAIEFHGGATGGNWPGNSSNSTTPQLAYSYIAHQATAQTCNVNAGAFTNNMFLLYDLRQTHINTAPGPKYSWFTVIHNTSDTLADVTGVKYFNPVTIDADTFKTKIYDLSAYAGTNFTLTFKSSCKYVADSAIIDNIRLVIKPVVDLGPDTSVCPGTTVLLHAGNAPSGYIYTYQWHTLLNPGVIATTPVIFVDSAATYIVNVSNQFGLSTFDTIIIGNNPLPVINLGPDVSNCISYTIDAGTGFSSYLWSDGDYSQTTTVSTTGDYWVEVSNSFGCTNRDTIHVAITPAPTVDAGADQTICYLDSLILNTSSAIDFNTLAWASSGTGTFNDSTVLHAVYHPSAGDITAGTLNLTLTAYGTCDTLSSLMILTISSVAVAEAGPDVSVCEGSSVQLNATGGSTYLWSPALGLSSTSIQNPLASPTSNTTYSVTVSSSCGTATDEVLVTVNPSPVVSLGNDTIICYGASLTLDAGAGFSGYAWSTGDNTQTTLITFAQTVVVTVSNVFSCTASDAIVVDYNPAILLSTSSTNATCGFNDGTATVYANGGDGSFTYLWSDNQTTALAVGLAQGTYIVTVTDGEDCFDTISVYVDCTIGIVEYAEPSLHVFPNPTYGLLNIELINFSTDHVLLNIFNSNGQLVLRKHINGVSENIDMSVYPSGIYNVIVNNGTSVMSSRIINQK
jgi:hypothetical protein